MSFLNPDFQHQTVLLHEAVAGLAIKPAGVYVDGTFGRGGHSRLILSQLGASGRLIAFDKDPAAIAAGALLAEQDSRFQIVHEGFAHLSRVLQEKQIQQIDGALLDLGVSSPQIDEAARGFSFRFDAPLDMRMDTSRGITAAEWLKHAPETELVEVIRRYGEERCAKQIAKQIIAARVDGGLQRTRQLAELVAKVVRREPGQDPATRTFQAIRIFINQELKELTLVLPQITQALALTGRLSVISFHSLEDRIVKEFMREQSQPPVVPSWVPIRAQDMPKMPLQVLGKPVRASAEEVAANNRSRSAILRIAARIN